MAHRQNKCAFLARPNLHPQQHNNNTQLSDGLAHFHWHERGADGTPSPHPELDLVTMPGEASLGRLGAPGTRVFKLAFTGAADRTVFLWPQEPDAAGDDRLVAAFNKAVSDAGADDDMEDGGDGSDTATDGGSDGGRGGPIRAADLAAALLACGMPPPPGGAGAAAVAAPAPRRTAGSGRIDAASLAAALAGAGAPGGSAAPGGAGDDGRATAAAAALRAPARAPGPSLAEVLRPDALRPLLSSDAALAALDPHLPEGHRSLAGLHDVLSSAQWRSQLDTLSGAFTTGQLDLAQFGLRAGGFTVADFLQAVQDAVDEEKKKQDAGGQGGGEGSGGGGGAGEGGAA
jgi:26S proteasome regulatory subunit N13